MNFLAGGLSPHFELKKYRVDSEKLDSLGLKLNLEMKRSDLLNLQGLGI
jgi:hypothetical protein